MPSAWCAESPLATRRADPSRGLRAHWRPLLRPAILGLSAAGVLLGHALVPVEWQASHDLLVRLFYLPIVLGGLWYGIRGGLGTAGVIVAFYLPHVLLVNHGGLIVGYLLEIPVFFGVGLLTGLVTDRQAEYRRGLEAEAETLARSHRELQDQTRLLLEKEVQLRRADRLSALGQLSAGLAHEIRNPLGAIKGAVEILEEDYPPGHPKAEFSAIIVKEVQRLNEVLTNFLSFARPVSLRFAPLDVREVLVSLEGLISGQARAHRVQIFTNFHDGPGRVMADEALLKQAFLNLILNALEAMPEGGDLAISTRLAGGASGVEPAVEQPGEWLDVVIDDTGHGIPDADLGRIFDPFFTTKKEGTGLGLAITYRIIQNHHGTIRILSQVGQGATVIVTLPLEGTIAR